MAIAIRGAVTARAVAIPAPNHRVTAQKEADQQTAAITEKDRCGVEVEPQEPEETTRQRSGRHGERQVPAEQRGDQGRESGKQPDAGGEPVHSVDQVERIGAAHKPDNGYCHPSGRAEVQTRGCRHTNSAPIGEAGSRALAQELLPGLQPTNIIEQSCEEDHRRRGEQFPYERQILLRHGRAAEWS